MLSRIARNVYELGQQIERAENIARILDVNRRTSLEQRYFSELDAWSPMLAITHSREAFDDHYDEVNGQNVLNFLVSDSAHPYSIRRCIRQAREMARTVRERISEEMWLYLNRMYLDIDRARRTNHKEEFITEVQQFCSAFHGLVDNTMNHGESWHFLQLGVLLERALMTSRILEIKYHLLLPSAKEIGKPLDLHQWQALLRSVSGYEAYRRQFRARIEPSRVINLLNLDPQFPRSIHFCIRQMHEALKGIGISNREQYLLAREVETLLDDLRGGAAGEDILKMGLKDYLEYIQKRLGKISFNIHRTFFDSVTITVSGENREKMSLQIPQQQQQETPHALAEGAHVRLRVIHKTRFDYTAPISLSQNELRMSPIDTGLQRVISHRINVSPGTGTGTHRDYFGNIVTHFNIIEPHDYLEIDAESLVETTNAISCGPESTPDPRPYDDRWSEFLCWSPGVPELEEYDTVPHGHEIDMAMDEIEFGHVLYEMGRYFYRTFRYDPEVTHVHSSPKELFRHGGGVCQDMAHAMIGVLRRSGVPARYVSGYIFDPAKGEFGEHIRGSGATHAWVQAWHEGYGWVGIDPTNDKLVDWQYVRTAIGRDYFDVQPMRGIFRGHPDQRLEVSVHVSIAD